jgi:hypothetical protein
MKNFTLLLVVFIISGCASNVTDISRSNESLLNSQELAIKRIVEEMDAIKTGNGGDISKWDENTVEIYKIWQSELQKQYNERNELIALMLRNNKNEKNYESIGN